MNWIGYLGILYIAFWNVIGIATWKLSNKSNDATKWIPFVIASATIPPFLMGWFGNE